MSDSERCSAILLRRVEQVSLQWKWLVMLLLGADGVALVPASTEVLRLLRCLRWGPQSHTSLQY